jgi:integrase
VSRNIDRWVRTLRDQIATLEVPTDLNDRFSRYENDPVGFARQVLGTKTLPQYQESFLRSVAVHERVALGGRTCNGRWRVMSEIRLLRWDQVDFDQGVVQLRIRATKNNEPRTFPLAALPQLGALLERQREHTDEWEQRLGTTVPFVFHRKGKPISDFRHAWRTACRRAGVLGNDGRPKVPHDFRRTAVRNLVRAGVPENTAMKLTGHKTREVFDRYDIVSGADLVNAVGKLAKFHGAKEDAQPAEKPDNLGTIWAQSEASVRTA